MAERPLLSVVVPAKDESENLPLLVEEIRRELDGPFEGSWELLIVDDGSTDRTWEVVRELRASEPRIRAWRFRYCCGKAAALAHGFAHACGEYVATMDGDLQDRPAELVAMREQLESENLDLVSGWKRVRHDPWHKTLPSKLFNAVVSLVAGLRLHDYNCGIKFYRRAVAQSVRLYGDYHRFIPAMAHWMGYRVGERVVEHRPRVHGVSKYGVSRLVSGFLDLVSLLFLRKFAVKPLHLFGTVGLLFVLLGGGVAAWFLCEWVRAGALHVRPLMVLGMTSLIMGLQFVSLGLLGEMVNSKADHSAPVAEEI